MRRLVLLAALAAVACDHPPVKEIAAAEQEVESARAAGAERYAPERWNQARDAVTLARQRVESRDYHGALSSAHDAAESARLAIDAIGPAKQAERKSAEEAVGGVRAILDRAVVERGTAVKAGVPKATLAGIDAQVQRAERALAAATVQLETADVKDVLPAIDVLRAEVAGLPGLYTAARTRHAQRPKERPRGRSRGAVSRRPSH